MPFLTRVHPARIAGAGLAVGLVLTGLAGPPAPARADGATSAPLAVGTFNIRAGVSTASFRSAVQAFAPRVDIGGLQEVNSRDKEAEIAALAGMSYYRPRDRANQCPVFWRTGRFTLVSGTSKRISPRWFIGSEPRGPWIDEKRATVVRLVDTTTGAQVSVINVHLIPGAIKAGRPVPERPKTARLYKREVRRLMDIVDAEAAWGQPYVLGDYNVGYVADFKQRRKRLPFRSFRRRTMISNWAGNVPDGKLGTHNDALIDQVYSLGRAGASSVQYDITESDHWPAVATYDVPIG
ncbi:MAG: hypothetical protein R2731_18020 [Nocardioides sp.]